MLRIFSSIHLCNPTFFLNVREITEELHIFLSSKIYKTYLAFFKYIKYLQKHMNLKFTYHATDGYMQSMN